MIINNEDVKKAKEIIYWATLDVQTRKTLYELVENDMESFIISSFEAYMNRNQESKHFEELGELISKCKNKSYFRGIVDALEGHVFSELTELYFSGWRLGYRSGINQFVQIK